MPRGELRASTSALRALAVLKTLKGQSLTGLSNQEICERTGETPPNVTRALLALMEAGLVERTEAGHYTHSIQMTAIAVAHAEASERLLARLVETNRRILAGAQT